MWMSQRAMLCAKFWLGSIATNSVMRWILCAKVAIAQFCKRNFACEFHNTQYFAGNFVCAMSQCRDSIMLFLTSFELFMQNLTFLRGFTVACNFDLFWPMLAHFWYIFLIFNNFQLFSIILWYIGIWNCFKFLTSFELFMQNLTFFKGLYSSMQFWPILACFGHIMPYYHMELFLIVGSFDLFSNNWTFQGLYSSLCQAFSTNFGQFWPILDPFFPIFMDSQCLSTILCHILVWNPFEFLSSFKLLCPFLTHFPHFSPFFPIFINFHPFSSVICHIFILNGF